MPEDRPPPHDRLMPTPPDVPADLVKERLRRKWEAIRAAPPPATAPADPVTAGKVELLEYLAGVAGRTSGAEVWRALFAEMRLALLRPEGKP